MWGWKGFHWTQDSKKRSGMFQVNDPVRWMMGFNEKFILFSVVVRDLVGTKWNRWEELITKVGPLHSGGPIHLQTRGYKLYFIKSISPFPPSLYSLMLQKCFSYLIFLCILAVAVIVIHVNEDVSIQIQNNLCCCLQFSFREKWKLFCVFNSQNGSMHNRCKGR